MTAVATKKTTRPSWHPGSLQVLLTSQPKTMPTATSPTSLQTLSWARTWDQKQMLNITTPREGREIAVDFEAHERRVGGQGILSGDPVGESRPLPVLHRVSSRRLRCPRGAHRLGGAVHLPPFTRPQRRRRAFRLTRHTPGDVLVEDDRQPSTFSGIGGRRASLRSKPSAL